MKRISLFAICFVLAAILMSLAAKRTRWAARSVWSSVAQPLHKEYGYYDAYRLVLYSNRKDLEATSGGKLLMALTEWDDSAKLKQIAGIRKQTKYSVALDALIAGNTTLDARTDRQAVIASIQNGKDLEPDNAYWDLCEWQMRRQTKDDARADQCLHRAAAKSKYDNHHRETYGLCYRALHDIVGQRQFLDSETAFFTRPGQYPRNFNKSLGQKSEWTIQRRYDAIRVADLVVRNTDWSLRPLEYPYISPSLLNLANEPKKLTGNQILVNAGIVDAQAKNAGIFDSRFSVQKVFYNQAAAHIERDQTRYHVEEHASGTFFDRLSAANQSAAALALAIPLTLIFVLGQRLRQHPGVAIALPLAAMAAATFMYCTRNEYLTLQCLSLLVASVAGLVPVARKWLWLAAIPVLGSIGLCWLQKGQLYKPEELLFAASAAPIGLAICLPKMPTKLSLALSVLVIGGVLFLMSRAWSLVGVLTLENKNGFALAAAAALVFVAPRTKSNPNAVFATVLIGASAAYLTFILRFASSP